MLATGFGSVPAQAQEPETPSALVEIDLSVLEDQGFVDSLPAGTEVEVVDALTEVTIGQVTIELPGDADGRALVGPSLTVNGRIDGTDDYLVVTPDAFAVLTETHEVIEYRFPVQIAADTTLVAGPNGALHHVNETGELLGVIDAAVAIDQTGVNHPAAYSFDAETGELVMTADLTEAEGLVIVDPGWKCYAYLGALGLTFILGIIGWFWSPWAFYYYLKAMPFISNGAAWKIMRYCF